MDLSMFPVEFVDLRLCLNTTSICYSRKVVGQYCEQYNKSLIKGMKQLKFENINTFYYLPFILNKTHFQSHVDKDCNIYPLDKWSGNFVGKPACGDRFVSSFLSQKYKLYVKYNLWKIYWIHLWEIAIF